MISFYDVPDIAKSITGLLFVILFFGTVLIAVQECLIGRRYRILLLSPMALVSYFMFQFIINLNSNAFTKQIAGQIPFVIVILIIVLILIAEVYLSFKNRKWRNNHITDVSVKEAIDNLPVGICCFSERGIIVLKNKSMQDFCYMLLGKALLNGNKFKEKIDSCKMKLGDKGVVILENGKVYSVSQQVWNVKNETFTILIATDITVQYDKTKDLTRKKELVVKLNEELVLYGKEIVSSITAREILNAKVKLHDKLGANLLASKRYILSGGSDEDKKSIIKALEKNIEYLRYESKMPPSDEYEVIIKTAEKLGVRIKIIGTFPQDEPYKHILVTGIHECLTNTLRHANGNEITLVIVETEGKLTAVFSNNGNQPEKTIVEKGGLLTLRSLVENAKGTMIIESKPYFSLTINLIRNSEFVIRN